MADSKKKSWFTSMLSGALQDVVIAKFLPVAGALLSGFIAHAEGFSWLYIYLSTLAAFAFIGVGLINFSLWLEKINIKDKLTFAGVQVIPTIDGDGLLIRTIVQNTGPFPMFIMLVDSRPILEGMTVPGVRGKGTKLEIPALGHGWFDTFEIPNTGAVKRASKLYSGSIKSAIRYGKKADKLDYTMDVNQTIALSFGAAGEIISQATYDNSEQDKVNV